MTGPAAAPLAPPLAELLELVEVDPDEPAAVVAGERVGARDRTELRSVLAAALYRTFHAGLAPADPHAPVRARQRRDLARERELTAVLPYRRRSAPVQVLSRSGGDAVVRLDGVRVLVPATAVGGPPGGERIELPAVRPCLSPGFLLADGPPGPGLTGPDVVRLYAHVPTPAAGVLLWRTAGRVLHEAAVPHRMKTTSSVTDVARRDGLVVYLGPAARGVLDRLVSALAGTGAAGSATSPFVRRLAPGLGAAVEPRPQPGRARLSFGQDRSRLVAEALVSEDCRTGRTAPAAAVAAALTAAGVDPLRPYRALGGTSPPLL